MRDPGDDDHDDDGDGAIAPRVAGAAIGALAGLAFGLIAAVVLGVLRPELAAARTIVGGTIAACAFAGLVLPRFAYELGAAAVAVLLGLFDGSVGNGELRPGSTTSAGLKLLFRAAGAAGVVVGAWWFWL